MIVVTPADLKRLIQEQAERSEIVAEYDAYMAQVRKEMNPNAKPLTEENINRLVHELR